MFSELFLRAKRRVFLAGFLIGFCSLSLQAQTRIDLTEGTVSVDGALTFDKKSDDLKHPWDTLSIWIASTIGINYFMWDNFALGVGLKTKWNLKSPAETKVKANEHNMIGLKLKGTYYFDIASNIFPYFGLNITPAYAKPGDEGHFVLDGGFDLGLLVSLNESVALNFGVSPEVRFPVHADQKWSGHSCGGFLGISAFF